MRKIGNNYYDCPNCGKNFYMPMEMNAKDYLYKIPRYKSTSNYVYFCSYSCWRKGFPEGTRRYKRG